MRSQTAKAPKCSRSFSIRSNSGFVKDAKGELIPPHHIEVVEFEYEGQKVFTALWGPAVSKDPYVKFSFKGGKKGDDLKVSWIDNKGAANSLVARFNSDLFRADPQGGSEWRGLACWRLPPYPCS